jgi:hypothetical protein
MVVSVMRRQDLVQMVTIDAPMSCLSKVLSINVSLLELLYGSNRRNRCLVQLQ